jgi:hypothetical protein
MKSHPQAKMWLAGLLALIFIGPLTAQTKDHEAPAWIRSAKSGLWSESATWQGGKVPPAGSCV